MNFKLSYFSDFLSLFFPELCAACNKNLLNYETAICTDCLYNLPYTHFHDDPENRVAKQLWGRVEVEAAASLLYFRKGSMVQTMLHQLKYQHKPQIAERLGAIYGAALRSSERFSRAELLVPVPLHPKRLKKRGYNQSEHFAIGISETMGIPVSAANLKRCIATETQTRKSRFMRYENMQQVFEITDPAEFQNKHILLVDDVITTGATLEACAIEVKKNPGCKVSIAAIAFAE